MSPLALSLRFLQAQPDGRLVALARDGHEPAFEALVRRYRRELLAYCRRLQPQSGSAEDTLQQAFLQAWRALVAGAEVRDVRPWLYRIAHNVAISNLRAVAAAPQEIEERADGAELHQLVEQRLRARAALAAIAALPALQRQVMVSTTLDGSSHEEVAHALGLTSGAVRGMIYRARAALRTAAAAMTPSPALGWAVRHAGSQAGGITAMVETFAGGGGAGVAALVLKGGAVVTLAGAFAGAGAVILPHAARSHHPTRHDLVRFSRAPGSSGGPPGSQSASAELGTRGRPAAAGSDRRPNRKSPLQLRSGEGRTRGGSDHRGADGGPGRTGSGRDGRSSAESNGSSTRDSSGGRDGGSSSGAGATLSGSGSRDSRGSTGSGTSTGSGSSSGSSDGGGSGSGGPGSDGGGSGQTTTTATTSDTNSGSDGTSSSSGGSGSGDTTTTSTLH